MSCIRLPQVESPAPEMGCALGSVADHRWREKANHRTGRHTDRKRPNERHRKNNLREQRVSELLSASKQLVKDVIRISTGDGSRGAKVSEEIMTEIF